MMVSILGCGWYGLALAKTLVADGMHVKGSGTSAAKLDVLKAAGISPFLIDLSAGQPNPAPNFFLSDVLVIAIPPRSRSGEGAAYLPKMQRAVDAILASPVKKVILISSTGVYADLNRDVNELTDPQPNTPSGMVLFNAEQLFKQQTTFKTCIIRFGGLLGPGRDPGKFFAGKKNVPNGLAPVNLIHLDDCIGITKAIIDQDVFGYTINACAPHHPKKAEFYSAAAIKSGLEKPTFLDELVEWKRVNSVITGDVLKYNYKVINRIAWGHGDN